MPEWLFTWPTAVVTAGIVAVLWSQWDRLRRQSLVANERFDRYLALRQWCQAAGRHEAVEALDRIVLPALVSDSPQDAAS